PDAPARQVVALRRVVFLRPDAPAPPGVRSRPADHGLIFQDVLRWPRASLPAHAAFAVRTRCAAAPVHARASGIAILTVAMWSAAPNWTARLFCAASVPATTAAAQWPH